jgi:hypothetical protein
MEREGKGRELDKKRGGRRREEERGDIGRKC